MKTKTSSANIEFSVTRAFEIKGNHSSYGGGIDWSAQTSIGNQTRAMSSNNNQKRVNITVCKNAKGW